MNNECKLVFETAIKQAREIWGDQFLNHAELAILQAFDNGNGQFMYAEIRNDEDGVRGINTNIGDTFIELPPVQISRIVTSIATAQQIAEKASQKLYPDNEGYTAVQRYFDGPKDCHLATVVERGTQDKTDAMGYVIEKIPFISVKSVIPLIQLPTTTYKLGIFQ